MFWLLAREVLQLRGEISRDEPWNVMVDLFMYRNLDEKKKEGIEAAENEEADAEAEPEDTAVANTMKQFDGEGQEGEDDDEEEGDETWTPNPTAGANYAQ